MDALIENPIAGMDAIPMDAATIDTNPEDQTSKFPETDQLPSMENANADETQVDNSFDMSSLQINSSCSSSILNTTSQSIVEPEASQEAESMEAVQEAPGIALIEEVVFAPPSEADESTETLGIGINPIVTEPQEEETSETVDEVTIEPIGDDQTILDESAEKSELSTEAAEQEIKPEHVEIQIDDTSSVASDDMILEETTGEYKKKIKSPVTSRKKVEIDDKCVTRFIEETYRTKVLKPGEQIVIVMDDEQGNRKETLLTHNQTTVENGVTFQHVVDENGEVYMIEVFDEREEEHPESEQEPKKKIPLKRGRKTADIPNHVLGRNIENPATDSPRNGKPPPKPRLGVKVPYRNLTSQMVTKQEIAEEVFQRSRRFGMTGGQNLFAQKLSSNLAKKLNKHEKNILAVAKSTRSSSAALKKLEAASPTTLNNSDLLAILEGDGDDAPDAKTVEKPVITPEMEREMALKQLSELPDDEPMKLEEQQSARDRPAIDPKTRFSPDVPIKTYSRKRKPSTEFLMQYSYPKNPSSKQANPTSKSAPSSQSTHSDSINYVTKSSRIIKRKIIWDPDETSPKKVGIKSEAKESNKFEVKKEGKHEVKHESRKHSSKNEAKTESKKVETPMKKVVKPPVALKITRSQKKFEDAIKHEQDAEKESKSGASKTPAPTKRRRTTEITKLLMDEGAVNMLYSIKTEEAPSTRTKSLKLKTDELLSDLQSTTGRASPKALRKKDIAASPSRNSAKMMCPPTPSPIARQKSKDSNRSSVHSPPPSPGQSFAGSESRIIRRHSGSSYSSIGEEEEVADERKTKKVGRKARVDAEITPELPRRKVKAENAPATRSKVDNFEKLVELKLNVSSKYNEYDTFTVKELNKMIQIKLEASKDAQDRIYLTNEMMADLMSILGDLEKDANVNVILVTSNGSSFCNGINFKSLLATKESAKKCAAKKMAINVKEFLLCLAKFPKVLIAGIHAESIGIGVTMLPLFDMIIADERAKFTIPNAKLGCIAEGGSLLLLPHLSRNVLINELLYSSQTLSAEDALKLGLVTKVLSKETYTKDLIIAAKNVSEKSAQFMVATKKQIRQRMLDDITKSLNDDTDSVMEQWLSAECQKSFAEFYN